MPLAPIVILPLQLVGQLVLKLFTMMQVRAMLAMLLVHHAMVLPHVNASHVEMT